MMFRATALLQLAFLAAVHAEDAATDGLDYVERPKDTVEDIVYIATQTDYTGYDIYVDGVKQSHGDGPGESTMVYVPYRDSHLVALRFKRHKRGQTSTSNLMAFIGSIETPIPNEVSVTNARWRCTKAGRDSDDNNWIEDDFDDSLWPNVEELAANGEEPFGTAIDVSSQAKWIWANVPATKIICRGWLTTSPDTLRIAVNKGVNFTIYVNNRLLGYGTSGKTYSFLLPGSLFHFVAVKAQARDDAENPSILSALHMPAYPTGVSGKMWHCVNSSQFVEDDDPPLVSWTAENYDDNSWPPARQLALHGDTRWGENQMDISRHAIWVWTDTKSRTIYCRAKMASDVATRGDNLDDVTAPVSSEQEQSRKRLPIEMRAPHMSVDVLNASQVTMELFAQRYLSKSRPLVVRNGAKKWPAIGKWSNEYLKKRIGHYEAEITFSDSDVFHFYGNKRDFRTMTIAEYLDEFSDSKKKMYMAQQDVFKEIRKDVIQPWFSHILELQDVYLWMGAGNQVTPAHFDNAENIMSMVAGRKRMRLYEPAMTSYLYAQLHNKHTAITSAIPNLTAVNYKKFPDAYHAKAVFAEIEAGDMLFLPAYWWHEVTSYGRNIAVNWWFDSHSDMLNAFFEDYVNKLPQTKWGVEDEKLREELQGDMSQNERDEL